MTIRVLVVDDHPLYREGLVGALQAADGIEVAGEAGDGEAAIAQVAALAPDVVLMDLHMPVLTGVEATRRLVAQDPSLAVLVLTMLDGDDAVFAAMRAGARGYLLKGAGREEITSAIASVARGEVVFSAGIASRVLAFFGGRDGAQVTPFPELTEREREILDLVARGLTTAPLRGGFSCPRRRCATTCRTCSPSCRSAAGLKPLPGHGTPASAPTPSDAAGICGRQDTPRLES